MIDDEAFHAFLFGLVPILQEHVGAHVQVDLEHAMEMAQRLEAYRGGEGARTSGSKGSKKFKKQNKQGSVAQVQGNTSGGTILVVQGQQKQSKGKGRQGNQAKESETPRRAVQRQMLQFWQKSCNAGLPRMEGYQEGTSVLGKLIARSTSPIRTSHWDCASGSSRN